MDIVISICEKFTLTWIFQEENSCNYNIKLNLKYLFFSVVFLYIVQTALSLASIIYLVCLAKLSRNDKQNCIQNCKKLEDRKYGIIWSTFLNELMKTLARIVIFWMRFEPSTTLIQISDVTTWAILLVVTVFLYKICVKTNFDNCYHVYSNMSVGL